MEANYLRISGYTCKMCKKMHKEGDGLFEEHYAENFPLPTFLPQNYEEGRKAGIREVVEFVNDLIIGIEGCKFEERLDGDKGCIVLDMNENQWQAQKKRWGINEAEETNSQNVR